MKNLRRIVAQSLNEALIAFFQGRYASAEKSAAAALTGDETKGVAAIIAARSAHELGRFNEREQFLDHAKGGAEDVDQARLTTLADLLVSQERYEEALAVLNDLSARDSRNLRLRKIFAQIRQAIEHHRIFAVERHQSRYDALCAAIII